jgi:hypothetical protein
MRTAQSEMVRLAAMDKILDRTSASRSRRRVEPARIVSHAQKWKLAEMAVEYAEEAFLGMVREGAGRAPRSQAHPHQLAHRHGPFAILNLFRVLVCPPIKNRGNRLPLILAPGDYIRCLSAKWGNADRPHSAFPK